MLFHPFVRSKVKIFIIIMLKYFDEEMMFVIN